LHRCWKVKEMKETSRADQLRKIMAEYPGANFKFLARVVFERGIYTEDEFSGAKLKKVEGDLRAAAREIDPETGVSYFFAVRDRGLPKEDAEVWPEPTLSYERWELVVEERVQSMDADKAMLMRILDRIMEHFGQVPDVPKWVWEK
jgi:hypothetical protein